MQNQRRPFVCKRCGAYIDTRRRRSGGPLQCPECKMIYRPRPVQNQALQPQAQITKRQPPNMKKRWNKRRIFVFVAIILFFAIFIGSCGNNNVENKENSFSEEFIESLQQETEFSKTLRTYTAKPTHYT